MVLLFLRRIYAKIKKLYIKKKWPINENAKRIPIQWKCWPGQKKFALVLTHDVDNAWGLDLIKEIIKIEEKFGLKSCFYIVPEKYDVPLTHIQYIQSSGFEVGVHGYNHDGMLFLSEKNFNRRVETINKWIQRWNAKGFRSSSMICNLDWIEKLDITYDSSTFDYDPFEPLDMSVKNDVFHIF